jgi:hypothetical protein
MGPVIWTRYADNLYLRAAANIGLESNYGSLALQLKCTGANDAYTNTVPV